MCSKVTSWIFFAKIDIKDEYLGSVSCRFSAHVYKLLYKKNEHLLNWVPIEGYERYQFFFTAFIFKCEIIFICCDLYWCIMLYNI